MVCLFYLSSQINKAFSFSDFCYGLLCFLCMHFCPNFYDFFPSTNYFQFLFIVEVPPCGWGWTSGLSGFPG